MQTKNPTATENKSGGMSRRHFLGLTAGAIGLTMTPPMLATAKTTSGGTALRSKWQQVRNMFSFSEGSVPMNAANLCPSFKQVAEKVFELTRNYELATAAMVSVAFSNLVAYRLFGRSLFDRQLRLRGFDLSMGRDKVRLAQLGIGELMERCVAADIPAVAITDQNNLFGMVKFYRKALAAGIKPIVGADLRIATDDEQDKPYKLILLCQDRTGYRNLSRLLTRRGLLLANQTAQ